MKHLKKSGWIAVVLLGVGLFFFQGRGELSGPEAQAMVKQGALLLDVRTPAEFAGGHVEGAVNLPHDQVLGTEPVFADKKNTDVVIYCRSGRRSAIVAGVLRRAGFNKVHDLGAMSNWER